MTLTPGTRLGPYEVVARLGAGGMGEVYKATDTRLGRTVAVKVSRDEFSERFEREARAVAALNHPNICQLYDVGPNYLVMEFVDGTPVQPGDRARLLDLASQIAEALVAAHAAGIVHRDLKPDNILVTRDGRVKVLDFGLATGAYSVGASDDLATQAATAVGTTVGTVAYMSPEQARGEMVDARSDLWSLGVVLYELATGVRPFRGATAAVVFEAILNQAPPALPDSGGHVPSGLSPIVVRLLEKDRKLRYQSAADLRADLARLTRPTSDPGRAAESRPSIAVLPFANMSRDADDEYFSDGLAEEIINALVQVRGLKVIARTSAFAFKGRNEDVRRIAEVLGVTTVLEGSVRRAGSRLRVTAQLIDASDGSHVWSQRYDRDLEDVFAIQDEIAQAVATALRATLSVDAGSVERYAPALPAYEALLKARYHLQRWTAESLVRGRDHLDQATALDPRFASAHSELGWCLFGLVSENRLSSEEAGALMRASARRALAIDPSQTDAHSVLGLAAVLDYEWREAGDEFRLALARDSISPTTRWFYATRYLVPLGRVDEAMAQIELAIREDPLNLMVLMARGMLLVGTNRNEEAEAALRQVLELDDRFWLAHYWLGWSYVSRGRFADAVGSYDRALAEFPDQFGLIGCLAGSLERAGEADTAAPLLEKLGDGTAFGAPCGWVFYHLMRSEIDRAADWFEKGIAQRDTRMPWFAGGLIAAGRLLVSSPRWDRLARLMNLPARQSHS
jgi:TolB-like protein/predicted Ser/Thr protein kinase